MVSGADYENLIKACRRKIRDEYLFTAYDLAHSIIISFPDGKLSDLINLRNKHVNLELMGTSGHVLHELRMDKLTSTWRDEYINGRRIDCEAYDQKIKDKQNKYTAKVLHKIYEDPVAHEAHKKKRREQHAVREKTRKENGGKTYEQRLREENPEEYKAYRIRQSALKRKNTKKGKSK